MTECVYIEWAGRDRNERGKGFYGEGEARGRGAGGEGVSFWSRGSPLLAGQEPPPKQEPPSFSLEEHSAGRVKSGLGALPPPSASTVIALSNKDEAIYIYLIKHHSPLMGHSAFPVCVSQKPILVLKLWIQVWGGGG